MPKLRFEKELSPEISSHLTNKFVPIEKETFYCKDSRGDSENFGAPGGDFGEFLLALDCYEKVSGKRGNLSAESVDEIFEKWLNERCSKERPFYLHSDRPALNRLLKSVDQGGLNLPIEIEDSTKKDEFIEKFSSSGDFQGCGHLRLILENPQGYSIDLKLFSHLSRAFFRRYFKGDDRVLFKVYEIPQDGCALVIINGSNELRTSMLSIQCLSDNCSDQSTHQVFILNQHAVSCFRKHFLVPFFGTKDGQGKMFEEMEAIGWRNAMMSANTLAGGKPIYNVELSEE